MANGIPELRRRKETDRRLSFGLYLVIILILVALLIAVAASMGIYWAHRMPWRAQYPFGPRPYFGPWFPAHLAGWIIAMVAIGIAVSIVHWWYQWQLYSRRNDHIERAKRLKVSFSRWLREKHQIDMADWTSSDMQLSLREQLRSTGFFVLWVIFSYLFGLVGFILTLVCWYWLTIDYAIHERGELEFYRRGSQKLKEKGISFDPEILHPLISRNMALYVVLMIIPGVNVVWGIWWCYVLFRDPNLHFETHEHWESQLEKITGEPGPSATPESPLEILERRYARGEITKEEFERIRKDLSAQ
ncbi:MAG: SHOCT domain-containing protein [bacterium]